MGSFYPAFMRECISSAEKIIFINTCHPLLSKFNIAGDDHWRSKV